MAAITVQGLQKRYGETTALAGLSLEIEPGELFGLLGPNGAGKTTTIEVLTGQTVPDSGSASVIGVEPIEEPTAVREQIGILPEKESPPSFMTPREYFQFVGSIRELSEERVEAQVEAWGERLAFEDTFDTIATDLSRGQQQKVMVAGAFLHEPEAVFIDEPLANLDPIMQERVKQFLEAYSEEGNTVLLSTHNVDVAEALCSRIGIVSDGKLMTTVRPAELRTDESLLDVFMDETERREPVEQ